MASAKQIAANRINAQKAGRPKGKKTEKVLEREEALKQFRDRVTKNTHQLFDAQFTLARGQTFLYRIDKEFVKTGTNKDGSAKGWYRNKRPVIVEDPEEIRMYLEQEVTDGDPFDEKDEESSYYYLSAKEPNNMAIDSLMDRTHGKSKQGELDVNHRVARPLLDGLGDTAKKDVQTNNGAKKGKAAK